MKKALIIGAGPAGLSASFYIARNNNIEVTVICDGKSTLAKADMIENFFGFSEPVSGSELLKSSRKNAERLGVKFIDSELVDLQITAEMQYAVTCANGYKDTFDAALIATGAPRKTVPIKGINEFEGKGVSYCAVCDAFFYRNRSVAVLGSGQYALHEAEVLLSAASSVTILTDGAKLSVDLPEGIGYVDKKIKEINGSGKLERVVFSDDTELDITGLFIAVGTAGSTDFARKIGAPIENGKIITDENRATVIPGLYAAGDCIGGVMQISKAAADGTIAGLSIIRYLKNMGK